MAPSATSIILRHHVQDDATFYELLSSCQRLSKAIVAFPDISFGLQIPGILTTKQWQEFALVRAQLPSSIFMAFDPTAQGAGATFQQIIGNPLFFGQTLIIADLDQYVIETRDALQKINELSALVQENGALLGLALRDTPVILAEHSHNSELRIINELFHSLAMKLEKAPRKKAANALPAYNALGDCVPGMYVWNTKHPLFFSLLQELYVVGKSVNMDGFETELYVTLRASQLSCIVSAPIETIPNPIYTKMSKEKERDFVVERMVSSTRGLAHTRIRQTLIDAYSNTNNRMLISEFFSESEVEFVAKTQLHVLEGAVNLSDNGA